MQSEPQPPSREGYEQPLKQADQEIEQEIGNFYAKGSPVFAGMAWLGLRSALRAVQLCVLTRCRRVLRWE
eukprot:39609-Eustigmatos_ZCMA.PRE.1